MEDRGGRARNHGPARRFRLDGRGAGAGGKTGEDDGVGRRERGVGGRHRELRAADHALHGPRHGFVLRNLGGDAERSVRQALDDGGGDARVAHLDGHDGTERDDIRHRIVFGGEIFGGQNAVRKMHLVNPAGPGGIARSVAISARQITETQRGVVVRHFDDCRRSDQGSILVDAAGLALIDECNVAPAVLERGLEVELGGSAGGPAGSDVVPASVVADFDGEGAVGRILVARLLPLSEDLIPVVVEILVLEPAGDDERVTEV